MVRERVCHRQRLPPPRAAPPLLHQRQSRVGGHRRLVRDRRRGSMPWPAALNCGCCSGTAGGVSGTDTAAELCSALPRPAVPSAVRAWTGACGAGVAATSTIGRDALDFGTVHTSAAAATPAVAAATPAAPAALGVAVATSCAAGGNRQPSAPLIQREPTRNGHVARHALPPSALPLGRALQQAFSAWVGAVRPGPLVQHRLAVAAIKVLHHLRLQLPSSVHRPVGPPGVRRLPRLLRPRSSSRLC